jgi:hypothetical protein
MCCLQVMKSPSTCELKIPRRQQQYTTLNFGNGNNKLKIGHNLEEIYAHKCKQCSLFGYIPNIFLLYKTIRLPIVLYASATLYLTQR